MKYVILVEDLSIKNFFKKSIKGDLQFTLSANLKKNNKIIHELKTFFSEIPLQWVFESSLSIGVFLQS